VGWILDFCPSFLCHVTSNLAVSRSRPPLLHGANFSLFFSLGRIAALASDSGLLLQRACRGRSVGLSVCLFVTFVNLAKTAKPIQMPFGDWLMWAQESITRCKGVKVGRIHSLLRRVTRWQCGFSLKFFDHLFFIYFFRYPCYVHLYT